MSLTIILESHTSIQYTVRNYILYTFRLLEMGQLRFSKGHPCQTSASPFHLKRLHKLQKVAYIMWKGLLNVTFISVLLNLNKKKTN